MRWFRCFAEENRWLSVLALCALIGVVLLAVGCRTPRQAQRIHGETDAAQALANTIKFAAAAPAPPSSDDVPFTIYDEATEYWELTPQEAIHIALQNATVLRILGGAVVRNPAAAATVYDPVLRETDPRFGVDAALSRFDAQVNLLASFNNNDRAVNNRFLGGGAFLIQQDLADFRAELTKRSATGTSYALRQVTEYDASNLPGNLFPSAWTTYLEGEVRHPLMRGGGVGFNRIAGPGATPGNINGVVIARLNTDISVIEFEQNLHALINEVENAYWDLYFAYRMLETRKSARDRSLQVLRRIRARGADLPGGVAEQEALAAAQYYAYEIEVKNSLGGRLVEGTQPNNGSRGGTFRGTLGIQVAERRLRLLMGVPLADGRLIRPATDPVLVRVIFDWDEIVQESMLRRTELRKQQLEIHRRRLEVTANKNFLLPQMDLIARHRFRGFGKDLIGWDSDPVGSDPVLADGRFNNAVRDLLSGDFQEWMLGVEVSLPVGFREAYNALRNAQLRLARDQAVLQESQREIRHDLANGIADLHRAYEVSLAAGHRRAAVMMRRQLLEQRNERTGNIDSAALLDVYRQEADADAEYIRAMVDHAIAIKNIHFEKGSMLEYCGVLLAQEASELMQPASELLQPGVELLQPRVELVQPGDELVPSASDRLPAADAP